MSNISKMNRFLLGFIITMQYLSGLAFFFLQGLVINAILKKYSLKYIISSLALIILFKSMMIISNTVLENIKKHMSNTIIDISFKSCFPNIIYKDFSHRSGFIFHTLNDHIQKAVTADINIFSNRITFLYVSFIYIIFLIYSKFLIGGIFVLLIALFSFINQLSWGSTLNQLLLEQHHSEKKLIHWIHDYFNAYKEISKTWPDVIQNGVWLSTLYQPYADQKKKIAHYLFKKNVITQFLVETPYLMASTAIFIGIYYDKISIPFAFTWLGISQFIITASQGLSKNSELKKTQDDSSKKITSLLQDIKKGDLVVKQTPEITNGKNYTITLQNGHMVMFTLNPGIYPIIGSNGSGKSTLLDTIINFDRLATFNKNPSIILLKHNIGQKNIRIIDPHSNTLECLGNFEHQIKGPLQKKPQKTFDVIYHNLSSFLPQHLAQQWIDHLSNLNTSFNTREFKALSSGEKILLSFARCWFSWENSIKLLLVDECDSALDTVNRQLFFDTLNYLKNKMAILIVSHNIKFKN